MTKGKKILAHAVLILASFLSVFPLYYMLCGATNTSIDVVRGKLIPGTYLVSFVIFLSLFGGHGFDPAFISAHLAGGGLMLGAFFMATDYVTRPITKKGQYLYGVFLGVLTGIFRIFGPSAEGVSYAIIIGNLIVPLIEKVTLPKAFGKGGERS